MSSRLWKESIDDDMVPVKFFTRNEFEKEIKAIKRDKEFSNKLPENFSG